jgi:hypothetical protein
MFLGKETIVELASSDHCGKMYSYCNSKGKRDRLIFNVPGTQCTVLCPLPVRHCSYGLTDKISFFVTTSRPARKRKCPYTKGEAKEAVRKSIGNRGLVSKQFSGFLRRTLQYVDYVKATRRNTDATRRRNQKKK